MSRLVLYGMVGLIASITVDALFQDLANDYFYISAFVFILLGLAIGYWRNRASGTKVTVQGTISAVLILGAIFIGFVLVLIRLAFSK